MLLVSAVFMTMFVVYIQATIGGIRHGLRDILFKNTCTGLAGVWAY